MEFEWIRENMETEQVIAAKPTQVAVETEVALPGGLREEAKVYYADATAVVNGGELTGSRATADGRVTFTFCTARAIYPTFERWKRRIIPRRCRSKKTMDSWSLCGCSPKQRCKMFPRKRSTAGCCSRRF